MLEIEITEVNIIEGGVEVFARAWQDGVQIGFGKDGTVDIERFRVINPPVLVEDSNGTVERLYETIDPLDGSVEQSRTINYREDTEEAILQSLEHTISVKQEIFDDSNIVAGKVGNTTTTEYPNAGSSTAPTDTELFYVATSDSWTTARQQTANNNNVTATTGQARLRSHTVSGNYLSMYRTTVGFDTSAIGTDTVSSATLSLYGNSILDTYFDQDVGIDFHNSVTEPGFALADYDYTNYDDTDQATKKDLGTMSASAYNDFSLNATGIGNIDGTGNTYFACRLSGDMDNVEPTWVSNASSIFNFFLADETGTSKDPKLVVEHAAAGAAFTPKVMMY